jgi:hypothetical protein
MKNIMAIVIVLSLIGVYQGDLLAKETYGAKILVHKRDGQRVEGELIAVKQKSLLLLASNLNLDVNVEIDKIDRIEIFRKDKGGVIGVSVVGGALLGGIIGSSGRRSKSPETTNLFEVAYSAVAQEAEKAGRTTLGIAGGLLVGALVGASLSSNQIFMIEGSSDAEIDLILKKLRKKARVPDYK